MLNINTDYHKLDIEKSGADTLAILFANSVDDTSQSSSEILYLQNESNKQTSKTPGAVWKVNSTVPQ